MFQMPVQIWRQCQANRWKSPALCRKAPKEKLPTPFASSQPRKPNENADGRDNTETLLDLQLPFPVHFHEHAFVLRSAFCACPSRDGSDSSVGSVIRAIPGDTLASQGLGLHHLWHIDCAEL